MTPINAADAGDLLASVQAMVSFAHNGPNGPRVVNADVKAQLPDLHDPVPEGTPEDDKVYWLDHLQRGIDFGQDEHMEHAGLTYTVDLVRGQLVRHLSVALPLLPPHRPTTGRTERYVTHFVTAVLVPFAHQVFGTGDAMGWKIKTTTYQPGQPWMLYVHFTAPARIVTPMHMLAGRVLSDLPMPSGGSRVG